MIVVLHFLLKARILNSISHKVRWLQSKLYKFIVPTYPTSHCSFRQEQKRHYQILWEIIEYFLRFLKIVSFQYIEQECENSHVSFEVTESLHTLRKWCDRKILLNFALNIFFLKIRNIVVIKDHKFFNKTSTVTQSKCDDSFKYGTWRTA